MSTRKPPALAVFAAVAFGAAAYAADTPGLGKKISEADLKAWDISVLADGTNLPPARTEMSQALRSASLIFLPSPGVSAA